MAEENNSNPLISPLDSFAITLLERAESGTFQADGSTEPQSIAFSDQIRAFDSVVEYLVNREKAAPQAPKASKLNGLKSKLHGGAAQRRTTPRKNPSSEAGDGYDAEGTIN